jgi:hypothetical protein
MHTDCASTRLLNILSQPKIQEFIADHEREKEKEKETHTMAHERREDTNNSTESDTERYHSFEETLAIFQEQY